MPFSEERTNLIKARLRDRLENGNPNQWEHSFFSSMVERFDRDGVKTHLSTAQYRKLHQLLGIKSEAAPQKRTSKAPNTPRRKPYRRTPPVRRTSPVRALYAPQIAVRRATRQVMWPIVLVLVIFGMIGSALDTLNSRTGGDQRSQRPIQATDMIVTGSSVNLRTGPSTNDAVMGQLAKGTTVRKLRDQGGWTQITSVIGTGWMSSRYLELESGNSRLAGNATTNTRSITAASIRVIDGDTIDVRGQPANVRLVGFNTPEVRSPQCRAELDAGRRATARLSTLIQNARTIDFERVACACQPGTEGTSRCNFGRQCGILNIDGTDVGRTLIAEGLAVRYVCGRTSCPQRPGDWCR